MKTDVKVYPAQGLLWMERTKGATGSKLCVVKSGRPRSHVSGPSLTTSRAPIRNPFWKRLRPNKQRREERARAGYNLPWSYSAKCRSKINSLTVQPFSLLSNSLLQWGLFDETIDTCVIKNWKQPGLANKIGTRLPRLTWSTSVDHGSGCKWISFIIVNGNQVNQPFHMLLHTQVPHHNIK